MFNIKFWGCYFLKEIYTFIIFLSLSFFIYYIPGIVNYCGKQPMVTVTSTLSNGEILLQLTHVLRNWSCWCSTLCKILANENYINNIKTTFHFTCLLPSLYLRICMKMRLALYFNANRRKFQPISSCITQLLLLLVLDITYVALWPQTPWTMTTVDLL